MICVSIVSHHHGKFIFKLLPLVLHNPMVSKVLLTLNTPEENIFPIHERLQVIHNSSPKGFGENHNHAFKFCKSQFFCVLNPDVEWKVSPFEKLIECLNERQVAMVAPLIKNLDHLIEDSARKFPTILSLLNRKLFDKKIDYIYSNETPAFQPDWVAGMFMLIKSEIYAELHGFDERYFMYCEDIDLCARLKFLNYNFLIVPQAYVIHDARRASRRNLKYFVWHLASLVKFFLAVRRLNRNY